MREFRALYEKNYGFVWSTVRRMGVRSDAIDDVVQDAFLIVFRRWSDLPSDRRRAWLYGIARRVSSNARKVERRRVRKHDALREHHPRRVDVGGRIEASTALDRFLAGLDHDDRELFMLGAVEGLTGAELSVALGAKPSTLYGRLQVLRSRFRADAGARSSAELRTARGRQPKPSAAGWALMVPHLGLATAAPLLKIGAVVGVVLLGGVAYGGASAAGPVAETPGALAEPVEAPRPPKEPGPIAEEPPLPAPAEPRVVEAPPNAGPPAGDPRPQRSPARPRDAKQAPSAGDPLVAEAALVRDVRDRVRRGDAEAALGLIRRHHDAHPDGVLVDAVAALEVDALCALGRTDAARRRAAAFLRERPNTPVASRLSSGCAEGKREVLVKTERDGHGQE